MDSPKYNRTPHFPWSKGCTNNDKMADSVESLIDKQIIITEKMDGSNTSLEYNGCFARTHSGPPNHESFDGLKALHASVKFKIPIGIQLFGEWCFAKHSIEYNELPGYFMLFNVRIIDTNKSIWASWEEVQMWAEEIEVPTVPVLFDGVVNSSKELETLTQSFMIEPSLCGGIREGVVVRNSKSFYDSEFSQYVMKCVRTNHVQTSNHWKSQGIIKNILKH